MDRLTMPSAMPADLAEVLSDVGDYLTPQQESEIEHHAEACLAERIESAEWMVPVLDEELRTGHDLHAALMELDKAVDGDEIATRAVLAALCRIQKQAKAQARDHWMDDLRCEAEEELFGSDDA
jgi:hypothetical protein